MDICHFHLKTEKQPFLLYLFMLTHGYSFEEQRYICHMVSLKSKKRIHTHSLEELIPKTLIPVDPFRKHNYRTAVLPSVRQLSITWTETKRNLSKYIVAFFSCSVVVLVILDLAIYLMRTFLKLRFMSNA